MASICSFVVLGSLQASFYSWYFYDNNANYAWTKIIIFQFDSEQQYVDDNGSDIILHLLMPFDGCLSVGIRQELRFLF